MLQMMKEKEPCTACFISYLHLFTPFVFGIIFVIGPGLCVVCMFVLVAMIRSADRWFEVNAEDGDCEGGKVSSNSKIEQYPSTPTPKLCSSSAHFDVKILMLLFCAHSHLMQSCQLCNATQNSIDY